MIQRSRSTPFILVLALPFSLALAACGKGDASSEGASESLSPAARAEANQIFSTRCATCHGPQGAGNGPASAGLTPRPRNFTEAAWQRQVTNAHIDRIIQFGGAAVGKSPAMPPNPDLTAKPEVVAALRTHIRELSR